MSPYLHPAMEVQKAFANNSHKQFKKESVKNNKKNFRNRKRTKKKTLRKHK
jgi:hypothetical protein